MESLNLRGTMAPCPPAPPLLMVTSFHNWIALMPPLATAGVIIRDD